MDWAFRVIIFCLVCVIVISGYKVGTALYKYHHSRSQFKQVAGEAKVDLISLPGLWICSSTEINPDGSWMDLSEGYHNQLSIMHGSDNDIYLPQISTKILMYLVRFLHDYRIVPTSLISIRLSMVIICMTAACSSHAKRIYEGDGLLQDHKTFELITPDKKYHLQIISHLYPRY